MKQHAPRPSVTDTTLKPRVIAYSYEFSDPLNMTPYCTSIQVTQSIQGSTNDVATFEMVESQAGLWLTAGDWVQFDLATGVDGQHEHLFFGWVTGIDSSNSVLGRGGGTDQMVTVSVVTWAHALEIFRKDLRAFFQLRAKDVVQGAPDIMQSIPLLARIAQDIEDGFFAPAWVHVSMLMQMMARYGGALRQPFDLPESFTPDVDGAISLLSIICKKNKRRLNAEGDPLLPEHGYADGYFVNDLNSENVAALSNIANESNRDWQFSVWTLSDWARTFKAHSYYPQANGMLKEIMQLDGEGSLWAAMMEYSDAGWTELYAALVEHIDHNGSSKTLTAHDGTKFKRDFLCSISFQPIPHPVYKSSGTTIQETSRSGYAVEADATGYHQRPKFAVQVGSLESFSMRRSLDTYHNYWSVLPQDADFKGLKQYDAAFVGRATNWQFPIFDMEGVRVYGYVPLELETKYWLENNGKSFWPVLALKTALQYAWTIYGCNELVGSLSMPVYTANVPRPGDVMILLGERTSKSSVFEPTGLNTSLRDQMHVHGVLAEILELVPGEHGHAMSGYAESCVYNFTLGERTSVWTGKINVNYTHGQSFDLGAGKLKMEGRYHRFVQFEEVGLNPTWFLPYYWGTDIFLRLNGLTTMPKDPALAARIKEGAQSYRPIVHEIAKQRSRPKKVPQPPVNTKVVVKSNEPPKKSPPLAFTDVPMEREDKPKRTRGGGGVVWQQSTAGLEDSMARNKDGRFIIKGR